MQTKPYANKTICKPNHMQTKPYADKTIYNPNHMQTKPYANKTIRNIHNNVLVCKSWYWYPLHGNHTFAAYWCSTMIAFICRRMIFLVLRQEQLWENCLPCIFGEPAMCWLLDSALDCCFFSSSNELFFMLPVAVLSE